MNGRYNTTEFGSVDDPEIFKSLLDYSPYHNVRDGVPYPAVLLRMEAGGHLSGSLDQTIDETTDLYAFLFDQIGVEA
jgi:prolyl oligopeptidase